MRTSADPVAAARNGSVLCFACLLALVTLTGFGMAINATQAAATTQAKPLMPVKELSVPTDLEGEKPGEKAGDISGIACMEPVQDARRTCVLVNDSNPSAQLVSVSSDELSASQVVRLVGKDEPPENIVGQAPKVSCPEGKGKFGEVDGEAVVFAAPYFYVVGSHGCGRNSGKFKLSSFVVTRFRVDGEGRVVDPAGSPVDAAQTTRAVEASYRLTDALRAAPKLSATFGKDLKTSEGLNIEGAAIVGDRMIVGPRAPAGPNRLYLASVSISNLFAPGKAPLAVPAQVLSITLESHLKLEQGVRDLALLPDGRLLILAGPTLEQDGVPFSLYVTEPRDGAVAALVARELGGMKPKAKAEAVHVLDVSGHTLRALVLFDGVTNGGPVIYEVELPAR